MPVFYPGNILSSSEPNPGSGMWSVTTHMQKRRAGTWPATTFLVTDSEFEYTTLLLKAIGTNNQQNFTFLDSSTNNFSITRVGDATHSTFAPFGIDDGKWSAYFDGSGDYLSCAAGAATPCAFGTNDFTIEMWAYFNVLPATASDYIVFFDTRATSSSGLYTTITLKGSTLVYFSNGADRITSGTVTAGKWYHIALTRSGTSTRLFIDGTQAGSTYTDSSSYICASGRPYVGADGSANGSAYNGYLSNVRVINGTALYTSAFTPPVTPLTAVSGTALLTCQSNRFIDKSTNAFAITRNGDAKISAFTPLNQAQQYLTTTYGGAGYFDGTGDALRPPADAAFAFGTGPFCIEAWMYNNVLKNYSCLVTTRPDNGSYADAYHIGWDSAGGVSLYINTTSNPGGAAGTIKTGVWQHFVCCRDSNNVTSIFVDGVRVGTATITSNFTRNLLGVGDFPTTQAEGINGYISNLRLVKGSSVYDPTQTSITVPTQQLTAITNTSLLINFTNPGIVDASRKSPVQTRGAAKVSTSVVKYNKSMYFDGTSSSYLLIPNSENFYLKNADFTIEMWVRFNSLGDGMCFLTKGWGTINAPILIYYDGTQSKLSFYSSSSGSSWDISNNVAIINSPALNTWYHIAITRSGNTFRLFRDGTQTSTFTSSLSLADAASYPIIVGGSNTGGNLINAYIEDLRITRGVARYTAAFTPPTETMPTA